MVDGFYPTISSRVHIAAVGIVLYRGQVPENIRGHMTSSYIDCHLCRNNHGADEIIYDKFPFADVRFLCEWPQL